MDYPVTPRTHGNTASSCGVRPIALIMHAPPNHRPQTMQHHQCDNPASVRNLFRISLRIVWGSTTRTMSKTQEQVDHPHGQGPTEQHIPPHPQYLVSSTALTDLQSATLTLPPVQSSLPRPRLPYLLTYQWLASLVTTHKPSLAISILLTGGHQRPSSSAAAAAAAGRLRVPGSSNYHSSLKNRHCQPHRNQKQRKAFNDRLQTITPPFDLGSPPQSSLARTGLSNLLRSSVATQRK